MYLQSIEKQPNGIHFLARLFHDRPEEIDTLKERFSSIYEKINTDIRKMKSYSGQKRACEESTQAQESPSKIRASNRASGMFATVPQSKTETPEEGLRKNP